MRFDGHIHIKDGHVNNEELIQKLMDAGFDGGLLISRPPASFPELGRYSPFSKRLDNLIEWTSISENLFPVFWVDPLEEDAIQQIDIAAKNGVMGFKVICNNYYPSDKRAMDVFRAIAEREKPLLFHSGILWDGRPTSKYNKPVEFEALLEIDRLKFSLAHIAWPWCDELIAVYGKFQNALSRSPKLSCEMFIDLAPGTPVIYRMESLTKLLTVGYDIENNLVFGSDCYANNYNVEWARSWRERDNNIYEEIGVLKQVEDRIYRENLRRFIGVSQKKVGRKPLLPGQ